MAEHSFELQNVETFNNNGETRDCSIEKVTTLDRIKEELNEKVYKEVRLWMVIIGIFVGIFIVTGISLVVCSVIHEDVDEKYDPASFIIPRCFNGSFQLTNQMFTADLLSPSTNQSQRIASELQMKLSDIFRSSPALGRYFSQAQVFAFRNGSVVVQYRLRFLMPLDHAELERFTLSRELAYNVFRQNLYDQETDPPHPLYVNPASLGMRVEHC
ncbi:TPA-induced transmembrane protein [Aplochiton taeniatus]